MTDLCEPSHCGKIRTWYKQTTTQRAVVGGEGGMGGDGKDGEDGGPGGNGEEE